ncbi:MAG TPA: hypothetical protein H9795_08100 [Candidatus Fournierella merdigallinarum]|nr:hypothetical protein [Candidatus Fournierella merdigallinarum]
MTKRERFEKFLANEPVDRVPVAFFHHFTTEQEWLTGLTDEAAFEKNIEGHRIARAKFDPDVIKIMNDTLMIMPVDTSFVKTAADLRKIQPPMPGSAFFEKSKELTKRVVAIYEGSDAPIYITAFSPCIILRNSISGMDIGTAVAHSKLYSFLEEDPESVMAALDIIADSVIALNKMLLTECGAEAVYLSVNNQAHYVPDEFYTKYIAPSDKKVLAAANELSKFNMLHICGYHGKANNLELFKDYDVPVFNWAVHAEGVGLAEGKKLFGGKPVCGGFAQAETIYTGTREEVTAEAAKYLDEVGQVGVMLGADCTVPTDIDDERLEWVRQAAIQYAANPRVKL